MKYTITIDAGTTNTRAYLWDGSRRLIARSGAEVGVHDTAAAGNNSKLKSAVRGCLEELLRLGEIGYSDVEGILASGMITSNMGLYELPHVPAPAGTGELAGGSREVLLEDVCPVPIRFIPGVKNAVEEITAENFETMDMMRGEEVETLAILDAYPRGTPYLLVLPGSHTKFVATDEQGRITGCLTTITGELLDCITGHTIIADAVGCRFVSEDGYCREMVLRGFETGKAAGLARGAFAARILNQFGEKDKEKIANFLLGVVLSGDVQSLRGSRALKLSRETRVIVSGKNPLRRAIADVLEQDGFFCRVEQYTQEKGLPLSGLGSFRVLDELCPDYP